MKSLLSYFTGRSTPQRRRRPRFQPRFRTLESRRLFAGLQDLQVTVEVRFITLQDNYFEQIGIDFDFEVDDNSSLTDDSSSLPNDAFTITVGPDTVVGLDPNGHPTLDLDLKIGQNAFGSTTPNFGGFDAKATNFGFAILSDIEVFFVLEAAQGDARTNVQQAPEITLFNGQSAFISDTSSQPFVTSVIRVVG